MLNTFTTQCEVTTVGTPEFVDITEQVEKAVGESGISDGRVVLFASESGCALLLNEKESGLLSDLKGTIERLRPHTNGSGRSLVGSTSLTIPIVGGRVALGTWQRVLLVGLDEPGSRSISVQIVGERG